MKGDKPLQIKTEDIKMKTFKKILVLTIVVAMLITSISLIGCTKQADETYNYVSLKINPEVDFVVDSNGKVVSTYCLNEDAEVLLSDVSLNGKTIEEATETVVNMATEAGYIDVDTDGKDVEVGVIDEEGNENTEMYEKIEKNINSYFENNGIFGKVTKTTLDTYAQQAVDLGYSVGHVKLMMLAIDRSGKTLDEIKDMKINEIVKLIHDNNLKKEKEMKNGNQNQERKQNKQMKCNENAEKLNQHKNKVEANKPEFTEQIKQWQGEVEDN